MSTLMCSFNQIRRRAGLSEKMILSKEDILNERRIEFALEAGKFWLDLLRIDRDMAKSIIRSQDRGTVNTLVPLDTAPLFVGDGLDNQNFLLPIPAAELSFIDTANPAVDYIIND